MPDKTQKSTEVLDDTILTQELIDEARDILEKIDSVLLGVDKNKIDIETVGDLIKNISSLSSVMTIGCYPLPTNLAHSIVAILTKIKNGTFNLKDKTVDALVLSIEYLHVIVKSSLEGKLIDENDLVVKQNALDNLESCPENMFDDCLDQLLISLDPDYRLHSTVIPASQAVSTIDLNSDSSNTTDLEFFRDMMEHIEYSHPELSGRGDYILNIAQALNNNAGKPVSDDQLEAAAYMHDFGMIFTLSHMVRVDSPLTTEQRHQMQKHPLIGTEIMLRMGGWHEATVIVMQHHEREDGSGYPEGISGHSICDGAKILAIADAICSMTRKQSFREAKRPFVRVAAEINNCSGSQFSPFWVDVFNNIFRSDKDKLFQFN